jgi:hypothetical protein
MYATVTQINMPDNQWCIVEWCKLRKGSYNVFRIIKPFTSERDANTFAEKMAIDWFNEYFQIVPITPELKTKIEDYKK